MSTVELPRIRPETAVPSTGPREDRTLADLVARLGDVPLDRIRLHPFPGTATEQDVIAVAEGQERRSCELIEGVLVEKAMGFSEARLALILGYYLQLFLDKQNLGIVIGDGGQSRYQPGIVRIPDVAFISWGRLPQGKLPTDAISDVIPDLAVEVLSRSNTAGEMERKRRDYFANGVRLVWEVSSESRSIAVFRSPTEFVTVTAGEVLTGGDVLPGFALSVQDLFDKALGNGPAS